MQKTIFFVTAVFVFDVITSVFFESVKQIEKNLLIFFFNTMIARYRKRLLAPLKKNIISSLINNFQ